MRELGREDILCRLKQESYTRAVQMTGCDIDPDDVAILQEADGTHTILPLRSRRAVWGEDSHFERYEYDPWVWIECDSPIPLKFRLIMRQPIHQATFIMFPDWMTLDGATVSVEVLESIIADLWQRAYGREVKSILDTAIEEMRKETHRWMKTYQEVLG